MKLKKFFIAFLLLPVVVSAQTRQFSAAEIAQAIAGLGINAKVLYIAAHPDDENTRLLSYLVKEKKVSAAYLSLTRGDGGQNLIGNEQGHELGLIRTQELLAARKIDGAAQYFTRANDFGFSKTAEETFKIWGKQQVLADVVWLIRSFKPDIIITRFPEDKRAGHGHHVASAILAREAFFAAADQHQFTEQFNEGVTVWQAKRLLWNTFNFGGNNTTAPNQLKINVGLYNPVLGQSYGEIAAISRTNHKSQGFGSTLQRGEAYEYFSHTAGDSATTDLFDGVKMEIENVAVVGLIKNIQKNFDINAPASSIKDLLKLKKITANLPLFKHQLLDDLILAAIGFYAEAVTNQQYYAKGDEIIYTLNTIYRAGNVLPAVMTPTKTLELQTNKTASTTAVVKAQEISQPYYLKNEHLLGSYVIEKQLDVGHPENTNELAAQISIVIDDIVIKKLLPIRYKYTDPIKGEIYQPLVVAPKVTATLSDQAYLFVNNQAKAIELTLKSFSENVTGELVPVLPAGWKSSPEKIAFKFSKKNETQLAVFTVLPNKNAIEGQLKLQVIYNDETSNKAFKNINYDHIPSINIFPDAMAKLLVSDLNIAGKKIAYLEGAGDRVANALRQVGYDVVSLSTAQVMLNDLSVYDAIVTGVRFFNVHEDANNVYPKLMAYVKNGGVLLAQYNVNNGLKTSNIGPQPFKLGNKRVTEEDAKVNLVQSTHRLLNYPNKITTSDFDGWVQERGLYFVEDIDAAYETILTMNDKDEIPHQGSLIVTNYGKGKFVYTSLSFFRQLPAGVPGAYRLFANLLAK